MKKNVLLGVLSFITVALVIVICLMFSGVIKLNQEEDIPIPVIPDIDPKTDYNKWIDGFSNIDDQVGLYYDLNYESYKDESGNIMTHGFGAKYYYNGDNKGKLFIDDVEIKTEKSIRQIYRKPYDFYDFGMYEEASLEHLDHNNFEYTTVLYILFDDGTMGYITTDDILKNDYSIKTLLNYSYIEYLIGTTYTDVLYRTSTVLYGIDENDIPCPISSPVSDLKDSYGFNKMIV